MLEGRGLVVRAGSKCLLEAVDVAMRCGRVTAVLGPNGAGKSTLLQCLAGLKAPDDGSVRLSGQPLEALSPAERAMRIGYLPQAAPLHWNVGVRALVALGRLPRRSRFGRLSSLDAAAIEAALTETDAMQLADRLAGSLSGGELARVQLARVLAGEPEWILADEPFAALDIAHRLDLAGRFRAIAGRGKGVVVVLHDLSLAARLADDILLLDRGQRVLFGPVAETLASPEVARVFGVRLEQHRDAGGRISLVPVERFP